MKKNRFQLFFLATMLLFGLQGFAQSYVRVSNLSGTATVDGISVTVTNSGGVGSATGCGVNQSPYYFSGGAGSYTFTFSKPVGSVQLPIVFAASGVAGSVSVTRNGVPYYLTDANLAGTVGTCFPGVLAVLSGGELTNLGNTSVLPNNMVIIPGPINSITVSSTAAGAEVFGVMISPSTYFQVPNLSGTSTVAGVTTTVTSSGGATAGSSTCGAVTGTYFSATGGRWNYSFSSPVDGINLPVIFSSSTLPGKTHVDLNGSSYSMSASNIIGEAYSTCSGGPATVSSGDLVNTGYTGVNASANLMFPGAINTCSVTNTGTAGYGHGLFITKGSTAALVFNNVSPQSFTVCENSSANAFNSLLSVTELNPGLPLTWSVVVAPLHGTITSGGVVTSVSGVNTPTGFTYQPTADYDGADGFMVQVSDGVNTVTSKIDVTVNEIPSIITGANAVCPGTSTTYTDSAAYGAWSSSNIGLATVGSSTGIVTGVAAGVATISYSLNNGCIVATKSLTVYPAPAPISGIANTCQGSTTALTDASAGGVWSSSNTSIASVGSGTGIVTGMGAGVADIYYTIGTGCLSTAAVTVDPLPTISGGASVAICQGGSTPLAGSGGATYSWAPANGLSCTNCANPVASPTVTTTYTVTGTAGTGTLVYSQAFVGGASPTTQCSAWTVYTASLLPSYTYSGFRMRGSQNMTGITCTDPAVATAVANALYTGTYYYGISDGQGWTVSTGCHSGAPGCGPVAIELANQGSCSCSPGYSIRPQINNDNWGGIDGNTCGAVSQTIEIDFFINSSVCSNSANVTVSVNPLPAPITGVKTVCTGSTTMLADASAFGVWSCSSALATIGSATGIVTGVAAGTTTITYELSTGCSTTAAVTIDPAASAISGPATVCVGGTCTLTDAGGGFWNSSNPSVATISGSGVVTGVSAGTTMITYLLATGCYATTLMTVNATAPITGPASICNGEVTTLSDAMTGGTWSSSNTAIATIGLSSGMLTGVSAGSPYITYTLPTGCQTTLPVTINPLPAAITGTDNVCDGSNITLADVTSFGAWSSNSTAVATVTAGTGVVTGIMAGTATISYTLTTGCNVTKLVSVNPLPSAIVGPTTVCSGSTITLSSASPGGGWYSGNALIATVGMSTGVVTGATQGVVSITYSFFTGCERHVAIGVGALPVAGKITGTSTVCLDSTITLFDNPAGGTWSSRGSGATVTNAGVVKGLVPGIDVIVYTVTNGCGSDSAIWPVNVIRCTPSDVEALGKNSAEIKIYPNPNSGVFTISGRLGTISDEEVSLEVTNMLGQVVYRNKVISTNGTINEQIALRNGIASGMYLVSVRTSATNNVFHIVIEQ